MRKADMISPNFDWFLMGSAKPIGSRPSPIRANSFREWGNHTRQHVFIEISANAPKVCWVTCMNHLQLLVLSKSRMNKVTFWTKIGHKNTVIESYLSWTTQMDNILKFPLTSRVKAGPFSAGLLWFVVAPSVQQFTSEINRKLVENLPFCDAYCPHESLLGFCVGSRLKFISVADWQNAFWDCRLTEWMQYRSMCQANESGSQIWNCEN